MRTDRAMTNPGRKPGDHENPNPEEDAETRSGAWPANWFGRSGGARFGPAVLFDLDGVISDASNRQQFLRGARQDWRGFFSAAVDDPPIITGVALTRSVAADHAVVILTARPAYMAEATMGWLLAQDVRHDLLVIRPPGDHRSAVQFKQHEITRLDAAGFEIRFAIDDDERIIEMYRRVGVEALYQHSGYYER